MAVNHTMTDPLQHEEHSKLLHKECLEKYGKESLFCVQSLLQLGLGPPTLIQGFAESLQQSELCHS